MVYGEVAKIPKRLILSGPEDIKPYDKMPRESERAWSAFQLYRDLPASNRTLAETYRLYLERCEAEGANPAGRGTLSGWKKKFNWDFRVTEFERETDKKRQLVWKDRRKSLREEEWDLARKLLDKARAMVDHPLTMVTHDEVDEDGVTIARTIIMPMDWKLSDIPKVALVASKLARLASGLDVTGGVDPDTIDAQIEKELARLAQAAGAEGGSVELSEVVTRRERRMTVSGGQGAEVEEDVIEGEVELLGEGDGDSTS